MNFKVNKFYTHKRMLDMVIYVRYIFLPEDGHTKLRIKWFNNGGMDVNIEETVKILKSEFHNWKGWDMV